jgi:hypothetical protein
VPWVAFYVGIAVLGLAVLGALTIRLWRQVREFGREVGAAGAKIATLTDELNRVTPPPR